MTFSPPTFLQLLGLALTGTSLPTPFPPPLQHSHTLVHHRNPLPRVVTVRLLRRIPHPTSLAFTAIRFPLVHNSVPGPRHSCITSRLAPPTRRRLLLHHVPTAIAAARSLPRPHYRATPVVAEVIALAIVRPHAII